MRLVFLLQFIILLSLSGFAADEQGLKVGVDFDNESPVLSSLYIRGTHLVYDCSSKHWVCTGDKEFNRCKEQRTRSLLDLKYHLPCASFDVYKSRKDCKEAQLNLTESARYERFCLNTGLEKSKLGF
jgi:hypothetical protein